jgi:hypothetical protein
MNEGTLDECIEGGCVESTFDDVAVENAFFER